LLFGGKRKGGNIIPKNSHLPTNRALLLKFFSGSSRPGRTELRGHRGEPEREQGGETPPCKIKSFSGEPLDSVNTQLS